MKHISPGISTQFIKSPTTGSIIISSSVDFANNTQLTFGGRSFLPATASWASNAISSSYSLTASYALNGGGTTIDTSSFVLNSQTASFVTNSQTSSLLQPYVLNTSTSSFVLNSATSSFTTTTIFNSFTSSINSSVNTLTNKTSSYITTGSDGTSQTINGSLIINQNLTVLGSSSIAYITSSQLNIGTNIITVNANAPAVRFGGLSVIDSGSSPQRSGSILFDSINNQWIFVHQNSGGSVTSSVFVQTPQTFNNIGNETTLTTNRVPKAYGGDLGEHIGDSNITDDGTKVSINSNVDITGSLRFSNGSLIGTASWSTNTLTASFAPDYVLNINTSSFVKNSQTSSMSVATASYINPLNQNVIITGSLVIQSSLTTFTSSITTTGINTLFTQLSSSYNSAFGKYVVLNGSNARAGEFITVWNSGSITYTDIATTDVGSTSTIIYSSSFSGANILLQASASAGWTIKMLTTFI